MPYVSSIERLGLARGLREGIESYLRGRFGDDGLKLMPEIEEIYDEAQLRAILKALATGAGLGQVRRMLAPAAP
jgi:hypothetical protein